MLEPGSPFASGVSVEQADKRVGALLGCLEVKTQHAQRDG
jgi:hypothetical protein